jgi:hypothetical protein
VATAANRRNVLEQRAFRCLSERGRMPNVIALDFAERGDGLSFAAELGDSLRDAFGGVDETSVATTVAGPTTSAAPGATTTSAPPGTVAPIPEFTQVTELTGGDPEAFCAAAPAANRAFGAWVVAVVSAPADAQGGADLVFAPLLEREVGALYAAAPRELVALTTELRQRITLALDELAALGFDEDQIAAQAREVDQLLSDDQLDALSVELSVLQRLEEEAGAAEVAAAVDRIGAAVQGKLDAIDLGEVDPDVAEAAGFDCLA